MASLRLRVIGVGCFVLDFGLGGMELRGRVWSWDRGFCFRLWLGWGGAAWKDVELGSGVVFWTLAWVGWSCVEGCGAGIGGCVLDFGLGGVELGLRVLFWFSVCLVWSWD